MRPADPSLPLVFTAREAVRAGLGPGQVQTRRSNGAWHVLRRGTYCLAAMWAAADETARHLLHARAALLCVEGEAWLSHATASALHGLPIPRRHTTVLLTRQPPGRTAYLPGLVVEAATLHPRDQRRSHGLPVTSMGRTVADSLRHSPAPEALAIADAAAARYPDIEASVARVLAECEAWPYAGRAARVAPLVDGRRESALESWSAWWMHRFGVPAPEPQCELYDGQGLFLGRVDFWWPQWAVAGEADGLVKYAVPAGGDVSVAQRALVAEKEREDRLRAAGADVVRWGARDLADPARWAARLTERVTAHDARHFRGTALPSRAA